MDTSSESYDDTFVKIIDKFKVIDCLEKILNNINDVKVASLEWTTSQIKDDCIARLTLYYLLS